MMLFLDVRVEALSPRRLEVNVVYQNPKVAARLPYQAANGTVLTKFPSGRVSVGYAGGRPVVALRGPSCPLGNWRDPAVVEMPDAVRRAAQIREAIAEFRRKLQEGRTP